MKVKIDERRAAVHNDFHKPAKSSKRATEPLLARHLHEKDIGLLNFKCHLFLSFELLTNSLMSASYSLLSG